MNGGKMAKERRSNFFYLRGEGTVQKICPVIKLVNIQVIK